MLREARELVRLAGPVILSRAGILTMAFVDTAFVARYGTADLAALSLGLAPVGTLIVTMVGLQMGTLVLAAQAVGEGRPARCGEIWRSALPYGLALGVAAALLCFLIEPLLHAIGEPADVAVAGGRVALIAAAGLPAVGLSLATSFLLEGIGRPVPGMLVTAAANLVNIVLNAWLVFGGLGLPPLGAEGSATSTTAVRWFTALAMLAYALTMRDRARHGLTLRGAWSWRAGGAQRRIGYAAGLSLAIEASAFSAMSLLAGLVGVLELGAFSVVFNALSMIFMIALGLATATAVRVGIAYGQGDAAGVARAGWTGLGINTLVMTVLGATLLSAPWLIPAAYGAEPALHAAALPLVFYLALILVADGGQVIVAHALRGSRDSWVPTAIHTVSYLGVMLPGAWWLTFPMGHGVAGLMQAILVASIVSVGLLSLRFRWTSRRAVRAGA